jgi:hypothetical protein
MMRRLGTIAALLLASTAATVTQAKDKKPEHVYGSAPGWEQYRQLAEADIRDRLIDPDSARIEWLGQYHKGGFKPFLQGRVHGYVSCGTVNARNRMGGNVGRTHFVVVVDHDRVIFAEVDSKPGGMIADQCNAALRAGLLPPLPTTGSSAALDATAAVGATPYTNAATGLTLRPMPDGAYVAAVAPASPAEAAGLKPGMVIISVNAIPLARMGDAMLKVVDAAGANASLAIVGGRTVTLGAQP